MAEMLFRSLRAWPFARPVSAAVQNLLADSLESF